MKKSDIWGKELTSTKTIRFLNELKENEIEKYRL